MGIEHIIIITDDPVGKQAHIQTQFKGTDLVPARIFLDGLPVIMILMQQEVIHGLVDPVIMPLCKGAGSRVTVRLLQEADLVLRRQDDGFHTQPLPPQKLEGVVRHRSCNGFRRQIKNALRFSLAHGLHRRENRGERLSHSRGSFNEQLLPPHNAPVHVSGKLLLSFSVRIGKNERPDRIHADLLPFISEIRPLFVLLQQAEKPFLQLPYGILLRKIAKLLRLHIAVGHPNLHPLPVLPCRIHIGIALRLCQMHGHRLLHLLQIPVGSLDLIYGHGFRQRAVPMDHAVRASLHHQSIGGRFIHIAERHLRLIIRSHPPLDHPVDTPAFRHRIVGRCSSSVIDIPAAQNEFHQSAYRNPDLHPTASFRHECPSCGFHPLLAAETGTRNFLYL